MPFNLGNVKTSSLKQDISVWMPTDESVCGIIFDIGSPDTAFVGYSLAKNNFGNNDVRIVNNIKEAEALGITKDGFLSGVPYYHIKHYFDYIGQDKELYISFVDMNNCESPIERMVIDSNCRVFQIGIWTEIGVLTEWEGKYSFSSLLPKINSELDVISGNENTPSQYPSGINVIVCGGIPFKNQMSCKDFPDCKNMSCREISILLGGDQSNESRVIQSKIKPGGQVGILGLVMACLSLAYAEENIAHVGKFNLNKEDIFTLPVLGIGRNDTPICALNRRQLEELASKGYIFPVLYEAKEGGVYLSGDFTMTEGIFSSIYANRIKHKAKRIAKKILVPMMNGNVASGNNMDSVSLTDIAIIENSLNEAFDTYMVNKIGEEQISGHLVNINPYQPELKDNQLSVGYTLALLNSNSIISFIEKYNTK